MKFLADQDVYQSTVAFLQSLGHDVVTAAALGLSKAADVDLLRTAQNDDRLMVTRDRDYGGLVFVLGSGAGVIYLRMLPSTIKVVHEELAKVLASYAEAELKSSFVVVEPGRHRIRKIPPNGKTP